MLNHLRNRGGALDFADTKTLLAEQDGEWDPSEVPQLYFYRVEKAIQGLTRAGITSDLNERRDMALYYLKASGEFEAAVRDWENRQLHRCRTDEKQVRRIDDKSISNTMGMTYRIWNSETQNPYP
jgi:hypothetical protein